MREALHLHVLQLGGSDQRPMTLMFSSDGSRLQFTTLLPYYLPTYPRKKNQERWCFGWCCRR